MVVYQMATNTFRLQYLAKTALGVPRDLMNTFINAKVHPIRPTVLIYNCTWVCDAKCEITRRAIDGLSGGSPWLMRFNCSAISSRACSFSR